ncbi:MAG TPA: alpha-xenorhabdolysin family binary toxin subunit A [Myxococcota bacterium]|nr:alpha-xenorhabdolysin family binary toxin subunit A [Myxococcota bacterium]
MADLQLGTARLQSGASTVFAASVSDLGAVRDLQHWTLAVGSPDLLNPDLPQFGALHDLLLQWGSTTQPTMDDTVRSIRRYASNQIPQIYTHLHDALQTAEGGGSIDTNQLSGWWGQLQSATTHIDQQVASVMPTLNAMAAAWTDCGGKIGLAGGLDSLLHRVAGRMTGDPGAANAMVLAAYDADGSGDPSKQQGAPLYPVLMAIRQLQNQPVPTVIGRMQGSWGAITDDIGKAKANVDSALAQKLPILADLKLDTAKSEWSTLATEAAAWQDASQRAFGGSPPQGGLAAPHVAGLASPHATPGGAVSDDMNTGIASQSDPKSFLNSQSGWIAINLYTTHSAALPTTIDQLRTLSNTPATTDLTKAQPVLDIFKDIQTHCAPWSNTYTTVVKLASDLFDYANSQVPATYGGLVQEIDAYMALPDKTTQTAKDHWTNIIALVQSLADTARTYATSADNVRTAVNDFYTQTQNDQTHLDQQKDPGGQIAALTAELADLATQITTWKQTLQDAEDEYKHDVIVASTSPTYAWVGFPFCPVGLIAAGVVAGIYGAKAVAAKNEIAAAKNEIHTLEDQQNGDKVTLAAYNATATLVQKTLDEGKAALDALAVIKGQWGALADDLDNIVDQFTNHTNTNLPVLLKVEINARATTWADVAKKSDIFRTTAYINVTGSANAIAAPAAATTKIKRYAPSFKARIVAQAAAATSRDAVRKLLTEEGVTRSNLSDWRKAAAAGRLPRSRYAAESADNAA